MDQRIVKFNEGIRTQQAVQDFELSDFRKSGGTAVFTTPVMRVPAQDVELPQKDARFHFDPLVEPYVVQEADPEIDIQKIVSERLEALRAAAEQAGREAGYQEGFLKGQKEGKDEVLAASRKDLERLSEFLTKVEATKDEIFSANEEILNRISLSVCSAIIERELKTDKDFLKNRIRKLVQEYGTKEVLKIRVSPERYDEINALVPEFQAKFDTLKNLSVIPDGFMDGNDFIIETDFNQINASISKQLETFRQELISDVSEKA